MEFHPELLALVESGTVSVAFRRMVPGSVQQGQRFATSGGAIVLGVIKPIDAETLRECDAQRAGYATRAALMDELGRSSEGTVFRIELRLER